MKVLVDLGIFWGHNTIILICNRYYVPGITHTGAITDFVNY